MGIELALVGKIARAREGEPRLAKLAEALDALVTDPIQKLVARTSVLGDDREDDSDDPSTINGLVLWRCHPMAPPIEVHVVDDVLELRAKTSTVGPGYHAWLCDRARELGERLKIRWSPASAEGTIDDSGYWFTQDFVGVQKLMRKHARRLGEALVEHLTGSGSEPASDGAVFVHTDLGSFRPMDVGGPVVTPLGPRDGAWCRVLASEGPAGEAAARELLPWWDRQPDARAWLGFAMALLWWNVPWRVPASQQEADDMAAAVRALERARELDPGLALPDAELDQLRVLVAWPQSGAPAGTEPSVPSAGVGYRRGEVQWMMPGGWSLRAHGGLLRLEEEGGTVLLALPDRNLRFTSLTWQRSTGGQGPTAMELVETAVRKNAAEAGAEASVRVFDRDALRGAYYVTDDREGSDEYVTVQGEVTAQGLDGIAFFTFTVPDRQSVAWAEGMLATLAWVGTDDDQA